MEKHQRLRPWDRTRATGRCTRRQRWALGVLIGIDHRTFLAAMSKRN